MASLRHQFATPPGAWEVGSHDPDGNLYMRGDTWTQPDSLVSNPAFQPVINARLGQGQTVSIGVGGVFAVAPPTPPGP